VILNVGTSPMGFRRHHCLYLKRKANLNVGHFVWMWDKKVQTKPPMTLPTSLYKSSQPDIWSDGFNIYFRGQELSQNPWH
jgi:hypothetical protein